MNFQEMLELLEPVLKKKYSAKDITPEHELRQIIEDSLSLIELAIDIEFHYNTRVPDEDLDKLITVQDLFKYVAKYEKKCA